MIFVIGNGASRKNVNLDILKQHGKIIGCNALYRDFTPDHLFANDSIILHEILSSDYPKHHEVFLLKGEIQFLSEDLYFNIKKGGIVIIDDGCYKGCRQAVKEFRSKNNIKNEIYRGVKNGCNDGYQLWWYV